MTILDAARDALNMLNRVEIRGEGNVAAMSRAMAMIRGIEDALKCAQEDTHDTDDQQGSDV